MKKKIPLLFILLLAFAAISAQAQIINTIAGCDTLFYCDGCAATTSVLSEEGIALDKHGNVYICSHDGAGLPTSSRIRKVDPSGIITTFAGTGVAGYSGDGGPATAAKLSRSMGIAVDTVGNVYFTDVDYAVIRKIDSNGIITTFAGNGTQGISGDGGLATDAQLWVPIGVAADMHGNVFYTDDIGVIRRIDASGIIHSYAGNYALGSGYSGDGGAATAAQLNTATKGIAVDTTGNLYVSDWGNNVIRKVNTSGMISTIAGGGSASADGIPATSAAVTSEFMTIDLAGNLYLSTPMRVRRIDAAGIITTVVGSMTPTCTLPSIGDGGPATGANLSGIVAGVQIDPSGNIYVASNGNRIRKVLASTADINDVKNKLADFTLFPNPASNTITITANTTIANLQLFTPLGQVITCRNNTTTLDVSNLTPGLYYLKVNNNRVLKFVKE